MILSATGKTFDLFQAFMLFDQSCFCLLNIYTTFDSGFASSPTPVFWCKVRVECCSCTRRSHKSAGLSLFMLLLSSSMDGMKPCDLRSFDRICNYPRARPPEWFCHLSAANMEVFFFFRRVTWSKSCNSNHSCQVWTLKLQPCLRRMMISKS